MDDAAPRAVQVIGIGNELRRDDGAGIAVARRLELGDRPPGVRVSAAHGEAIELLERWSGCDAVVIVDSMRSGAAPGTIRRLDAGDAPLPVRIGGSSSTHAVSLGEAIELARALDRLPHRVVVYAVEGCAFGSGIGLSDEVAAAVDGLARDVLREARALATG